MVWGMVLGVYCHTSQQRTEMEGCHSQVHACTSFSWFFSELTQNTLPQVRHCFPLYLYDPNSTVSLHTDSNTGGPQNLNPTANGQQSQHEPISQTFPLQDFPNSLCQCQYPAKLMAYRWIVCSMLLWWVADYWALCILGQPWEASRYIWYMRVWWASVWAKRVDIFYPYWYLLQTSLKPELVQLVKGFQRMGRAPCRSSSSFLPAKPSLVHILTSWLPVHPRFVTGLPLRAPMLREYVGYMEQMKDQWEYLPMLGYPKNVSISQAEWY